MVYDAFGGVLTSTMPLAVSDALPGMPDAVMGLVHLGGGRWYDPALGRPLQPNPAGGPPTVPQRQQAAGLIRSPQPLALVMVLQLNWLEYTAVHSLEFTIQAMV